MLPSQVTLNFIYSIASLLAILPALWIAGQFLPRIVAASTGWGIGPLLRARSVQLAIWLALGSLFTAPLTDLLGMIRSLVEIISPSSWRAPGAVVTVWGSAPWPVFMLFSDLLLVAAYGFTIKLGWQPVKQVLGEGQPARTVTIQSLFVLFAIASLLTHSISSVVLQIVWLQVPLSTSPAERGLIGVVTGWCLGLLALALIIVALNSQLPKSAEGMLEQ